MILQADEAGVWTRSSVRIMRCSGLRGHRLSLGKVRDLYTVEINDGARSIDRDVHRVPFPDWLDWARQRFCKCVKHSCARVVVGPVANFDLVTSVDRHPR